MKKILVVSSYYKSLLTLRYNLIRNFYEKYELHIVTTIGDENNIDKIENLFPQSTIHKIDFKSKKFNIFFDIGIIYKLFLIIKNYKFDYILSYNFKPSVYLGLLSYIFVKVKFFTIITGLGYAFADKGLKRFILKLISVSMYILLMQFYKKIFLQNEDDYNFFKKIIIYKSKLINLNTSGIEITKNKQIFPDKLSFLFASRLNIDKGIKEFISVAKYIKKQNPEINFYIAGSIDANSPSSITKKILSKKISNDITYLGPFENIKEINNLCSVFVLPTYREGCPNIALEFMNMKKPIIISFVPGCKKIVKDGINGFFVKKKDKKSLIDKINYFINNQSLIKEFGNNSFDILNKQHSITNINNIILNEIHKL